MRISLFTVCLAIGLSGVRLLGQTEADSTTAETVVSTGATTSPPPPPVIKEEIRHTYAAEIEMVLVAPGPFKRGLPDGSDEDDFFPAIRALEIDSSWVVDASETPVMAVEIDPYWVGRMEVTNGQYLEFCKSTKRPYPPDPGFPGFANYFEDFPNRPVLNVSWFDAASFCNWLSRQEGLLEAYDEDWNLVISADGYHLPTEAEWEKAARGPGDDRLFPWGNRFPNQAPGLCNLRGFEEGHPSFTFTSPVDAMPAGASPYGLLHCAGNVWEWCSDWFDPDAYSNNGASNPIGPPEGKTKVLRGGSWADDAWTVRVTNRAASAPIFRFRTVGFRVALPATES